jgi:hypothetical protein
MIDQTESLKPNKHNSSSKRQGSIPAAASSALGLTKSLRWINYTEYVSLLLQAKKNSFHRRVC